MKIGDSSGKLIGEVAAFITRPGSSGPELLVIRHPRAGFQVPARILERGESPEEGVLREARARSGLGGLKIIANLGVVRSFVPDDEGLVLRMTKVFDRPAYDASSEGYGLSRGTRVKVTGVSGKFSAIIFDPLDSHSVSPKIRTGISGYVRSSILGRTLVDHFFHLTTNLEASSEREIWTDGMKYPIFWKALVPRPKLVSNQDSWLESYHATLLSVYS